MINNKSGIVKNNINKFATFYRLIDLGIIFFTLLLSVSIFSVELTQDIFILSLFAVIIFSFVAEMFALYRSWRDGFFGEITFYTILSLSVSFVFIYLFFADTGTQNMLAIIGLWYTFSLVFLVSWRAAFGTFLRYIRSKGFNTRSVVIIGLTDIGEKIAQEILDNPQTGYRLEAIFDDRDVSRFANTYQSLLSGNVSEGVAKSRANEFDCVYIALPLTAEKRISDIMQLLGDTTANVHLVPNLSLYSFMSASMSHVGNVQTISVYCNPMKKGSHALIKRTEDIILSVIILTLIALPLLVIALAVKLTSKGPVIFKQDRYGLNGQKIKVWKFRSMTVTENSDVVTQARQGDSRITPLGAFLRRTSLDELPQFFNVLQGRMSVVGPRPHAVIHNEEFRKEVPYYMLRHKVKPGITGWAQVNGWRGETDTLDKMEMRIEYDIDYIRRWSLWLDFKIVMFTLFRSFNDKNAY